MKRRVSKSVPRWRVTRIVGPPPAGALFWAGGQGGIPANPQNALAESLVSYVRGGQLALAVYGSLIPVVGECVGERERRVSRVELAFIDQLGQFRT